MNFALKQLFAVFAIVLLVTSFAVAQKGTADDKDLKKAAARARDAADAFNEIMRDADKSIPRELLERAEAVAVFPGVLKAAFIVGGRGGEGLISRRTATGWSAPAFFKLGGGSFGFQIGADKTDYIMLFLNDGGIKGLLEDKFEFGADAGIAAGSIGREASATTNATLNAGILSYSRSKGAFAGIALKGSRIAPNNEVNQAFYNKNAKEVLAPESSTPLPDQLKIFSNTLSRYSTRRGTNTASAPKRQRTADDTIPKTVVTDVDNGNTIVVGSVPRVNNPNTESPTINISPDINAATNGNQNLRTTNVESTSTTAPNIAPNNSISVGRLTSRPNNRLVREIRSELLELPYYDVFDWLEFEVLTDAKNQNTVILRGYTTRPTTKSSAENAVKSVEGVALVRNEIEVLPVSPNDDDLRVALYRQVYSGQLFRYGTGAQPPIHIVVSNGRVTLKGVVDSEADRNFANTQVNSVSGVLQVTNDLIVASRDEQRL